MMTMQMILLGLAIAMILKAYTFRPQWAIMHARHASKDGLCNGDSCSETPGSRSDQGKSKHMHLVQRDSQQWLFTRQQESMAPNEEHEERRGKARAAIWKRLA